MFNKSPFVKGGTKFTADDLVKWGKLYRGHRDSGADSDTAAAKATAGEVPQS
jgi:hypothetical protein